jgi:hypothetical protein
LAFVLNVLVSSVVISLATWLSRSFPVSAGFLVALPIASMLVLPLSYFEHGNQQSTIELARSIFIAIPVSLAFFIPFLLSGRLNLSFLSDPDGYTIEFESDTDVPEETEFSE